MTLPHCIPDHVELVELLPSDYTRPVTLVDFHAVTVPKSKGSELLKLLNQEAPLGVSFLHLKRVRACSEKDLEILVTPTATGEPPPSVSSFFSDKGFPACHSVRVPLHGALTRAQFQDFSKHWPMTYRKPSMEPLELTDDMRQRYASLYRRAEEVGGDRCGCVIVNGSGQEITVGRDASDIHPLKHAVMVAIDSVSALRVESAEAARPGDKRAHPEEEYLCHDYEVVTTHEPCVMCSMALVHSRVRLVAFGREDPDFGGLGGKFALHTCESLNHQFRVLRVLGVGNGTEKNSCDDHVTRTDG